MRLFCHGPIYKTGAAFAIGDAIRRANPQSVPRLVRAAEALKLLDEQLS